MGLGLGGFVATIFGGYGIGRLVGDRRSGPVLASPRRDFPPSTGSSSVMASADPEMVAQANAGRRPSEWGTTVTGVHTRLVDSGGPDAPTLALTFDACGGPRGGAVDSALLNFLEAEALPATLFLNQRWITANRALAERLAGSPQFELGNHGTRHLPLSVTGRSAYGIAGTVDHADAAAEVWTNHELLTELLGQPPRWFRSGTAHYDEVAVAIAIALGEQPVGFTTNGDAGATASAAQVRSALDAAPAGGIVLAHMNQPSGATLEGLAAALPGLRARGVRFVTISGGGGTEA